MLDGEIVVARDCFGFLSGSEVHECFGDKATAQVDRISATTDACIRPDEGDGLTPPSA
jgi:hypothetical protein